MTTIRAQLAELRKLQDIWKANGNLVELWTFEHAARNFDFAAVEREMAELERLRLICIAHDIDLERCNEIVQGESCCLKRGHEPAQPPESGPACIGPNPSNASPYADAGKSLERARQRANDPKLHPAQPAEQRCRYCNSDMSKVSAQGYLENPFCSGCLKERLEKAAANAQPGHWKRDGDYIEWVNDPQPSQPAEQPAQAGAGESAESLLSHMESIVQRSMPEDDFNRAAFGSSAKAMRATLAELREENKRLKRELDASVEYHGRCMDRIDKALNEPRYDDCELVESFVKQIESLTAKLAEAERLIAFVQHYETAALSRVRKLMSLAAAPPSPVQPAAVQQERVREWAIEFRNGSYFVNQQNTTGGTKSEAKRFASKESAEQFMRISYNEWILFNGGMAVELDPLAPLAQGEGET